MTDISLVTKIELFRTSSEVKTHKTYKPKNVKTSYEIEKQLEIKEQLENKEQLETEATDSCIPIIIPGYKVCVPICGSCFIRKEFGNDFPDYKETNFYRDDRDADNTKDVEDTHSYNIHNDMLQDNSILEKYYSDKNIAAERYNFVKSEVEPEVKQYSVLSEKPLHECLLACDGIFIESMRKQEIAKVTSEKTSENDFLEDIKVKQLESEYVFKNNEFAEEPYNFERTMREQVDIISVKSLHYQSIQIKIGEQLEIEEKLESANELELDNISVKSLHPERPKSLKTNYTNYGDTHIFIPESSYKSSYDDEVINKNYLLSNTIFPDNLISTMLPPKYETIALELELDRPVSLNHTERESNAMDLECKSNSIDCKCKSNSIVLECKNNSIYLEYKNNSIDIERKNYSIDLECKCKSIDFEHKSNSIDSIHKSNSIDLECKCKSINLEFKCNSIDLEHKSNSLGLEHRSDSIDLQCISNSIDLECKRISKNLNSKHTKEKNNVSDNDYNEKSEKNTNFCFNEMQAGDSGIIGSVLVVTELNEVIKNDEMEPPSYQSIIQHILSDSPPDYETVTGVHVNVGEIMKEVEKPQRSRNSRHINTRSCPNFHGKHRILLILVLVFIIACFLFVVAFKLF